jgi:hypothetical protein
VSQWCVNNKLKTTIGKAQETLTSFAESLRHKATLAAQNKPVDVTECRRILSFFDLVSMLNTFLFLVTDAAPK